MYLFHDSHDSAYRSPFGAAEAGSEITLSVDVKDCTPESVKLVVWQDDEGSDHWGDMFESAPGRYSVSLNVPPAGALLWYCFAIDVKEGDNVSTVYYGNNKDRLGGVGAVYQKDPVPYQITVYKKTYVPEWYLSGVFYQIFPDRFARDKGWRERVTSAAKKLAKKRTDVRRVIEEDWYKPAYYVRNEQGKVTEWPLYGGSLKGIEENLDYLRSLGVTGIYLNPIADSVSNHHYDTADYMKTDASLGTEEDFSDLTKEAAEKGIRIILDGVFSHTGDDSIYFDRYNIRSDDGAFHNEDSPYRGWYKFDDSVPCGYKCWWGIEDLPEVNEEDPGFTRLITGRDGVIEKWMKLGASGWRLDVADELPDAFIEQVRDRIRITEPEGLLIGEVWEDASNKISYGQRRRYFIDDELDGTMNYPLRTALLDYINYTISAGRAGDMLMSLKENYPSENFYSALNLIGTHDRERIITLMAGDQDHDAAVKKVKILSTLQYSLPGVPCIYYGDEAGLAGGSDPANRSGFPWGREDPTLMSHFRMLGVIYREHPVLASGDFEMISGRYGLSDDIFAFTRTDETEKILVVANRSYLASDTDLGEIPLGDAGYAIDLLTGKEIAISDGRISSPLHMDSLSVKVICLLCSKPDHYIKDRAAGVICHISSLANPVLGTPAKEFVDFLASAGMKVWQVLPLNPTGPGGSPYSSRTAFAGETSFINYDELPDDSKYDEFCAENREWLTEYAAYSIMKEISGDQDWRTWYPIHKNATPAEIMDMFAEDYADLVNKLSKDQYYFHMQWQDLKEYANSRGIRLMGDLPIYMAADSADVWANKDIFRLDEKGRLKAHAGVPPDSYNADGQDWGNPLYDWEKLKKDGYTWWMRRLRQCAERFDILRLDHFRALSEYYAIPDGKSAKDGIWQPGPGTGFLRSVKEMLDEEGLKMDLLAEDLGHLDAGVTDLLKLSGLSGMNVWQFSAEEMLAMPEKEASVRAFYSGTHDNNTMVGFIKDVMKHDSNLAELQKNDPKKAGLQVSLKALGDISKMYSSPAVLAMIQMQDILLLGEEARMNVPGVPEGNWTWKLKGENLKEAFPDMEERAAWFKELAKRTGRA